MSGPLQGCRVLDLGIITAGAATSALLADLGAEVIKIESPRYRDPFRGWATGKPDNIGAGPPFFRATNRNKTGISLDLKQPDGRAAFLRLVAKSDVVLENFRRGALTGLGLDFPVLREANPAIILASISSQGETGPDASYVSFGSTLEAMGGLAWQTGYRDGRPVISGRDLNYPDQVVAIFAAGMVVTAWLNRARENGVHLDLSQRELTSFLLGEMFPAGSAGSRQGNAETGYAVQGLLPDVGPGVDRAERDGGAGAGAGCASSADPVRPSALIARQAGSRRILLRTALMPWRAPGWRRPRCSAAPASCANAEYALAIRRWSISPAMFW